MTIMKIESVVRLPMEDSGLGHNIVRLNNRNVDSKRKDPNRFFRREPVVIYNPDNGTKVIRYVMGNPGTMSITKNAVGLDYDAVDALGVKFKEEVSLEMRRARWWEIYQWFWFHPDFSIRLSIRLGVVGALLGILGFFTGITPIILG
ncbi:TPA: hypothetical protein ACMDS2_003544 [Vibrio parahaemolyticus]